MVAFAGMSQSTSGTNMTTIIIKRYTNQLYDGSTPEPIVTSLILASQLISSPLVRSNG